MSRHIEKKWKENIARVAALKSEKINFSLLDFPDDQIYLLSVDGVNFSINEPRGKKAGSKWYDHKTHSAGISYEVALNIRESKILWINGPRPGEKKTVTLDYISLYNDSNI